MSGAGVEGCEAEGGEEAMTVLKMAALLLAANAAIGMIGAFTSGRRADDVVKRPT